MASIQNHIHLSPVLNLDSEGAPSYYWKASDREEIDQVFMTTKRSLTGNLKLHVLRNGSNPLHFVQYKYIIKIADAQSMTTEQRKELLKSMQGKQLYLVDHYHPDDGLSHAAHIQQVVMTSLGAFKQFMPLLQMYYVDCILEPISGVTIT